MNNPNIIPQDKLLFNAPEISLGRIIAVFAKAKMGMIKKFTVVCNLCSSVEQMALRNKKSKYYTGYC